MSTFWMAYGCLGCLPAQGCCRLRSLGDWALCHWSPLFIISLCTRKPTPCSFFALFSTEIHSVTPICRDFSRLFPSHLTQSKDAPLVSVHLMQSLLLLGPNIPCSNGNVFSPTEFGTSSTRVVPALVSDGERGRWDGPQPIRYGYSVIRCCHWWCVLDISLVRRCPLLFRLQVCVEWPSPRWLSFWT